MSRAVYDRIVGFARGFWLVAIAGCYSPSASTGAPCDERRICPSDQVCVDGRCQPPGTLPADAPIIEPDAPVDARPLDAFMLGPWSAPTPVGIDLATSKTDPSFTPDRLTVVFARADNLFLATRPAISGTFTVTELTALNTAMVEKSPEITADGKTIYFVNNTSGTNDVYVTTNVNGTWLAPVKVPGWDTASNEGDVAISPDELAAFVVVSADLRRATRTAKNQPWPAPATVQGVAWGTNPAAPSINAAGDVYFHANTTRDLFVAKKQGTGYAAPVPIMELNTAGRDAAPFVSADDRHLMFERDAELLESTR